MVLLGGVVAVLAIVLLATYVVRLALVVLLIVAAPICLVCHALPQTEGLARLWWRAFSGTLAVQVAQSLVLVTALRVFLASGGPANLGIASTGGLVDLLVSACLCWVLVKIPAWVSRVVFSGSRGHGGVGRVVRDVIIYKGAKALAAGSRAVSPADRHATGTGAGCASPPTSSAPTAPRRPHRPPARHPGRRRGGCCGPATPPPAIWCPIAVFGAVALPVGRRGGDAGPRALRRRRRRPVGDRRLAPPPRPAPARARPRRRPARARLRRLAWPARCPPRCASRSSGSAPTGSSTSAPTAWPLVCRASAVTFALRTPAEQEALVAGFARWLNSLAEPVQILVRAEPVDLSPDHRRLLDAAPGPAAPRPGGRGTRPRPVPRRAGRPPRPAAPARCWSCCARPSGARTRPGACTGGPPRPPPPSARPG